MRGTWKLEKKRYIHLTTLSLRSEKINDIITIYLITLTKSERAEIH